MRCSNKWPDVRYWPGDTVVWANHDDIPHTVTSKTISHSQNRGHPYFYSLHPHMIGTIVVEAATGMITPPGQHGSRMSGTDITLHKVNIR